MKQTIKAGWVRVKAFCKKWVSPTFLFLLSLDAMFFFAGVYYLACALETGFISDGQIWVDYCFSVINNFDLFNHCDCALACSFLCACASVFGIISQLSHVFYCWFVMAVEYFKKRKKST